MNVSYYRDGYENFNPSHFEPHSYLHIDNFDYHLDNTEVELFKKFKLILEAINLKEKIEYEKTLLENDLLKKKNEYLNSIIEAHPDNELIFEDTKKHFNNLSKDSKNNRTG